MIDDFRISAKGLSEIFRYNNVPNFFLYLIKQNNDVHVLDYLQIALGINLKYRSPHHLETNGHIDRIDRVLGYLGCIALINIQERRIISLSKINFIILPLGWHFLRHSML